MRTVIRVAALLTLVVSPLAAQSSRTPVTGFFITRLGTDTVAVEHYTRSGDKLVGDLLMRNPSARVFHYVADIGSNGQIKGMTVNLRLVGADTASPPMTSITTLFADSIATINVARAGVPDTVATGKKVYHGRVVPQVQFAPGAYGVYEQILASSKLIGTDSVGYVVIAPGRRSSPSMWITRRGRDSVVYNNTVFPGWIEVARVDSHGRILGVNSTATTVKTIATRADKVDIGAIAKTWGAADAARGPVGEMSPPDTVITIIDHRRIEVVYGAPFKRGRVIFGDVVPWNKVWRTGANAATQLTTSSDLVFGSTVLPHGTYTLWTVPTPTGAKLIINSQTGQWGTDYDMSKDFARLDLATKILPKPVDQFRIDVDPNGPLAGVLRLSWDTTEYSIPFTIK